MGKHVQMLGTSFLIFLLNNMFPDLALRIRQGLRAG